MAQKSFKANDLILVMEDFFKKAPVLPDNIREVLVRIVPWLALIFGALGILGGLAGLGLSPVAALGGVRSGVGVLLGSILTIVSSVLLLMSFPKLNKQLLAGWVLLFWSEVVNVVASLLTGGIVLAILGGLIGFYLLFQIKSYYK